MGFFRRRPSGDGLYRGDAPVSQPGWQGESPTAYQSPAHRPPAGEPALEQADPDRHRSTAAEPHSSWATPVGATATAGTRDRARRRPGTVGWLSLLGVGAVLLVGYAGYSILSAVQSALPSAQQGAPAAAEPTVDEVIDVPVTTAYRGQHIEIVVLAAQAQPATGWGLPAPSPEPHLVISVTLAHLDDTDPAPITIPFFDWTFAPADGQLPVPVTLISGFAPAIGSPTISPGNPVSGLLVFETAAVDGTLVLHPLLTPVPLVRWTIDADTATVVPGAIGQPVQAQVGRPPFTVTLNAATRLEPGADVIGEQPTAGGYLVTDLMVSAADPSSSGVIDAQSFVFIPAGRAPVEPTDPGVVMGSTATIPIVGGSTSPVVLAFDVPVGPGSLELRDRSGNPMIAWPVP